MIKKFQRKQIIAIITIISILVIAFMIGIIKNIIKFSEKNSTDKNSVNKIGMESSSVHINNENTSLTESESIISKEITPKEAVSIWENFIKSEEYEDYTNEYNQKMSGKILNRIKEYVIADVNADTIPELLIQFGDGLNFCNTWLFALDDRDIKLSYESYGYGSYRYSPSYNAVIATPSFRPFSGTGYAPFYTLQDMELKDLFVVGKDEGNSYYSDSDGRKDISDEERFAYFSDCENFDWQKIQYTNRDKNGIVVSGKWQCNNGVKVELENHVLTIRGKGELNKEVKDIIDGTLYNSSNKNGDTTVINKCVINEGITIIDDGMFTGCEALTDIEIPNSVISIKSSAFQGCTHLKNIKIPNSVTNIGTYAFWGCESLKSIEIPENLINMGEQVFRGCSSLSSIKVADGNKVYDSRNNCNAIIKTDTNELIVGCLTTKIPNSVTSIGNGAFLGSNLKSMEIPSNVTVIGGEAFENCNNLESIKIPNGVTVIGSAAFRGCYNLKNVEISDSVTQIAMWAFSSCGNLTSIEISSSVTEIGHEAFPSCKVLTRITNHSSVDLELDCSGDGQWYLESTDMVVTHITDGQTAVYRND